MLLRNIAGIATGAVALLLLSSWPVAGRAADGTATVVTGAGALRGEVVDGVRVFKGVPFAAPPVGEARWRESRPAPAWAGVRSATAFGPACAQVDVGFNSAIAAGSREDCLYLNVWTAAKPGAGAGAGAKAGRPVIVYFHGGANRGGSAMGDTQIDPPHDGRALARGGAVVVTANYRLGVFGFLAHPELTAESPHRSSGNYALSDMLTALRWVQANIAAFGGDPGRVTVVGQSAGAWNLSALMTSPQARGLMHGAILHSGNVMDGGIVDPDLAEAERQGVTVAARLGAPATGAVAALRAMPAEQIRRVFDRKADAAALPMPDINYDGHILPRYAPLAVLDGAQLRIPLIVGNTTRDGDRANMGARGAAKGAAAAADPARPLAGTARAAPLTEAGRANLKRFYGEGALLAQAEALYGGRDGAAAADADIAVRTDISFRCGARALARAHGKAAPAWLYEFSHGYEPLGAVHIWDVQYLFGVLSPPADQPRDRALAERLQRSWIQFAKTGDPNGPGLPRWRRHAEGGAWLDFASGGPVARAAAPSPACTLFDQKVDQVFAAQRAKAAGR